MMADTMSGGIIAGMIMEGVAEEVKVALVFSGNQLAFTMGWGLCSWRKMKDS